MADRFNSDSTPQGIIAPGTRQYAVTPANTDLDPRPRALMVTVGGNVVIRDELGIDITYSAVPAYTLLPFRAVQVRTGTTATVVAWE